MARGTEIVVTPGVERRGIQKEGIITGALKPGTALEVTPGTALSGTVFTYRAYAPGTDGERRPVIVLLPDRLQGALETDAYTTGRRGYIYFPAMGEELNMLKGDVSGTADDFAIGDMLMLDTGTGKVIASTGSPESEPFQCLETVTDPTADQLVWCLYTGY